LKTKKGHASTSGEETRFPRSLCASACVISPVISSAVGSPHTNGFGVFLLAMYKQQQKKKFRSAVGDISFLLLLLSALLSEFIF
jgi:hypothetical protein